jgi:preprotein translocase subunit SecB
MDLRIEENKVTALELRPVEGFSSSNLRLNLDYKAFYDVEDATLFSILFKIRLEHANQVFIKCEHITKFKCSEPINDAFKTGDFPKINAPAIAFPFLRSFIATLILNAGYPPCWLPSINFVSLNEQKTKKNS